MEKRINTQRIRRKKTLKRVAHQIDKTQMETPGVKVYPGDYEQ